MTSAAQRARAKAMAKRQKRKATETTETAPQTETKRTGTKWFETTKDGVSIRFYAFLYLLSLILATWLDLSMARANGGRDWLVNWLGIWGVISALALCYASATKLFKLNPQLCFTLAILTALGIEPWLVRWGLQHFNIAL